MTEAVRRGAIAGGVVAALGAGALLFAVGGRSGAAAQSALTVNLPPPVTDRIFGAPEARGRPIVVIDAGHGGRDPGATSVSGQVTEKELTLALARQLRDDLVKRGRVRVAMTREDDRYLTLDERAAVARRLNAAMFISLHMDSAPNALARGAGDSRARPRR
jgi:N-acetylmuramoyl-L-alanine amidase